MKNVKVILILSLVAIFNAACSGGANEEKKAAPAPVVAQEVKPAAVEKVVEAPKAEAVAIKADKEKPSSNVFKWANRKDGE